MSKLNDQPIEKRVREYNGTYDIHSVFYTIQGEGPFSGTPAVFVRLAGCNLQCPWCDTEYTQGRVDMSVAAVLERVAGVLQGRKRGLVVLTGGEPFRQPVEALLRALVNDGYYVQIECNGTLPPAPVSYSQSPHLRKGVYIVCSPKTGKINSEILRHACCLKYVAEADHVDPYDGLPTTALGHTASPILARPPEGWDRPIYLQPADHKDPQINDRNTAAVTRAALAHGYIIQLQIHKFLGVE